MKRYFKRVLVFIAAFLILLLGAGLLYYYPMLIMPSVKTGRVPNADIYTANAMSAVYLINTNNGYIMIDAGLSVKGLQKSLNEVMIDPDDVRWIFLTHSDGDHVNGLTLFPNAAVYMNEDELQLINGSAKRSIFGGTSMPSGFDISKINTLNNNQELLFNEVKIKCIKAPGHTLGSMVYLVNDKFLFTGDVLMIKKSNNTVHPYSMDKKSSTQTIEQLKAIIENSSIIFTSHYGLIFN